MARLLITAVLWAEICNSLEDLRQISFLILSELIDFYSTWYQQKIYRFLMMSVEIEVDFD